MKCNAFKKCIWLTSPLLIMSLSASQMAPHSLYKCTTFEVLWSKAVHYFGSQPWFSTLYLRKGQFRNMLCRTCMRLTCLEWRIMSAAIGCISVCVQYAVALLFYTWPSLLELVAEGCFVRVTLVSILCQGFSTLTLRGTETAGFLFYLIIK